MEHGKRGCNQLFIINNYQVHSTQNDFKMKNSSEKSARYSLIYYWECEWDNMYKDFHHNGELNGGLGGLICTQ